MAETYYAINRKSQQPFYVEDSGDSLTLTDVEGGKKTIARSSFKRRYTRDDDAIKYFEADTSTEEGTDVSAPQEVDTNEPNDATDAQQPVAEEIKEEIKEEVKAEVKEVIKEAIKEEVVADIKEDVQNDPELQALLDGAEEVEEVKETTETAQTSSTTSTTVAEDEEPLDIELLGTEIIDQPGRKTVKVGSEVRYNDYIIQIVEYGAYIASVKVYEAVPDDSEEEPKCLYTSPKMSIKDTLEWMELSDEDAKRVKRAIMSIRKQAKSKLKEQEA